MEMGRGWGWGTYDTGDEDVHACVDALEQEKRFGVFLRFLEFGNKAEEGDVAGVGEDDVRDGEESLG